MPFHVKSPARVKRVAKSLADALKSAGKPRSYSHCLDIVARMYGHAGYEALAGAIGSHPPSADDVLVPAAEAAARRTHQVAALMADGIGRSEAESIVAAIKPTDRSDTRKVPAFMPLDLPLSPTAYRRFKEYASRKTFDPARAVPHYLRSRRSRKARIAADSLFVGNCSHSYVQPDEVVDRLAEAHEMGLDIRALRDLVVGGFQSHLDMLTEEPGAPEEGESGYVSPEDCTAIIERMPDDFPFYGSPLAHSDTDKTGFLLDLPAWLGHDAHFWEVLTRPDVVRECLRYVAAVDRDFRELAEAKVTVGMLAAEVGIRFGVEPFPEPGTRPVDVSMVPLPGNHTFGYAIAGATEAAFDDAFDAMAARGHAALFATPGLFRGLPERDGCFVNSDGYVTSAARMLGRIQGCGFGLESLVQSVVHYASFAVEENGRLSPSDKEAWRTMLSTLDLPADFACRDLMAVAVCYGMTPDWTSGPGAFRQGVERLARLADAGVTLMEIPAFVAYRRFGPGYVAAVQRRFSSNPPPEHEWRIAQLAQIDDLTAGP